MNEAEKLTILLIAKTHKHMRISIDIFTDLLKVLGLYNIFVPITIRDVLETGHYADIYSCCIWVDKYIPPGHISHSDLEITKSSDGSDEDKWSSAILIENCMEYKRIINLKAFW